MSDKNETPQQSPQHDFSEQNQSKEEVQHQLEDLKQEEKVLTQWTKSSKDLIEQYKNKFDAFKAIADESGYIDMSNFKIGGEVQNEIFKKIDSNGDGKISKEEWNSGWNKLDTECQENQHKQTIAQQKISIMDALDSKIEPGKRLDQSIPKDSIPSSTNYSSILDRFKNAGSLDELSNVFSQPIQQRSPLRNKENDIQAQGYVVNFEIKKPSGKKNDGGIGQYKTPGKDYEVESNGRGSFINSFNANSKKVSGNKQSPVTRFQSSFASPSVGFINTNQFNLKQDSSINSKVQQTMNFQIDTKDINRTKKRQEDLQQYMGKLGLGKYDVPKVTVNLEQAGAYERLRNYVNGGLSGRGNTQGLGELVNDKNFSSTTFKQQMRAYKKEKDDCRGRSKSNGRESADQTLKSFHLKLFHQKQQSTIQANSNSGYKYNRN